VDWGVALGRDMEGLLSVFLKTPLLFCSAGGQKRVMSNRWVRLHGMPFSCGAQWQK